VAQLTELSEPTALAERLADYQQKQEETRIAMAKADVDAVATRIQLEKGAEVARQAAFLVAVKAKKRNIIIASVLAVVVAAVLVFTRVIQPRQTTVKETSPAGDVPLFSRD
jgi:hypothetical protein